MKIKSGKRIKPAGKSVKYPDSREINALVKLFSERKYAELSGLSKIMTKRFPWYGFGWKALGVAYMQLGQREQARGALQNAVALAPNDAETHSNLGITLWELGQFHEAEACCRQALQVGPQLIGAHINLGLALASLGRRQEAEASYRHALKIDASNCEALHGLGELFKELGRIDEAESLFLQALESQPASLKVRYSLSVLNKACDANFLALCDIEKAAQNSEIQLSAEEQVLLHFALGKCLDNCADYEQAYAHFTAGCGLKRSTIHYSSDEMDTQLSEIIDFFCKENIGRLRGAGNTSDLPIFILGMPRSGSTLLDQMLASHPDVFGAGELPDLMEIVSQYHHSPVGNLRSLDRETLNQWGSAYIAGLKLRAPEALHITDKMPGNYIALGLIYLMLPNAKIIHVRRNPADTCLSCFTQLFADGTQNYVYDLTELGRYYAGYARLMAHWREVLPAGAFIEVNYEDVVADPESQVRRMIEYCGLKWDDACLEFYKNERPVRTASVVQVRQPIYNLSVGRWRNYEKFLSPLFDALGDLAPGRGPDGVDIN